MHIALRLLSSLMFLVAAFFASVIVTLSQLPFLCFRPSRMCEQMEAAAMPWAITAGVLFWLFACLIFAVVRRVPFLRWVMISTGILFLVTLPVAYQTEIADWMLSQGADLRTPFLWTLRDVVENLCLAALLLHGIVVATLPFFNDYAAAIRKHTAKTNSNRTSP